MSRRSTVTKPRMTQGAAKKKMAPRMRTADPVDEALLLEPERAVAERPRTSPKTGRPPPPRPKIGRVRQAKASHHRLNGHEDAEDVQGTLRAR